MARSGTEPGEERDGTAVRALALVPETGAHRRDDEKPAQGRIRPPAGFVTQLLMGADPGLRPSRLSRTRDAAALYAKAARLLQHRA
ncbi:hypothetical protein [Methylobacterium sp. sgz302541]|uniref:hypothetical protein n=1 Tax=unclassified Methylobacterium TaxID=2615210 RepID=UPI003D35708E